MKNKFDKPLMETAKVWAKMSYCKKRQVGAVIAINNRIVSTGYNGTLSNNKVSNDCEIIGVNCPNCKTFLTEQLEEVNDNDVVKYVCHNCNKVTKYTKDSIDEFIIAKTKDNVVHAEQNALMFAAKNGVAINNGTIYTTTLPCNTCAKLIVQAGISKVVYLEDHDENGKYILIAGGVKLIKYEDDTNVKD